MKYIIVDLEATCWEKVDDPQRKEIIEIGATILRTPELKIGEEFNSFVKPVDEPFLSDFCKNLTSIRQKDIDSAPEFPVIFERFLEWIGTEPYLLCSWGYFDLYQFKIDCLRHSVPFPEDFLRHINLKQEFASLYNVERCGMQAALQRLRIKPTGTHHRAIDDVRNISAIARIILPKINAKD
ncbi:MAG: exonuclease domain-containing protein [Candidatus Aminicenantes bacterium]|nr:exonuclease domain-containing protein [Candidatus Aminicenantes bacterium]